MVSPSPFGRPPGGANRYIQTSRGERAAAEMHVPFLGRIPLDPRVSQLGDEGRPAVTVAEPLASVPALRELARSVAAAISVHQFRQNESGKEA